MPIFSFLTFFSLCGKSYSILFFLLFLESPDGITPTLGFSNVNLKIGKCNLTVYDLGGGENVRTVWNRYFAEVNIIIYRIMISPNGSL